MRNKKLIILAGCFITLTTACIQGASAYSADAVNDQKVALNNPVIVQKKWPVPEVLKEVSGITYISNNVFAAVQDEAGIIYYYNTQTATIEKEISFGPEGDYEGIALAGQTLYVLRSDGVLYEVNPNANSSEATTVYNNLFDEKAEFEGLCFDAKKNRLLLAVKKQHKQEERNIYAFDINTKKLVPQPAYQINNYDPLLEKKEGKKEKPSVVPSEIAVHPLNGNLYITDAHNRQLLILNPAGKLVQVYTLNKNDFEQPEGMAFSSSGELFIANEGNKERGNILKVTLQ